MQPDVTPEAARAMSMYQDLVSDMSALREQGLDSLRRCYSSWFTGFSDLHGAEVAHLDANGVPLVRVRAPTIRPTSVILHFHSGGYALGAAADYRAMGSALSRAAESVVFLIDYRLAPESPYPAALEDALTAYRWTIENGTPPSSIVLSGDSAGGALVISMLLRLRSEGEALPAGAVSISPFADLALTGASLESNKSRDLVCHPTALAYFARLYAEKENVRNPLVSPLYGDLSGLPPLLIIVGEAETLRDDGIRLAHRARRAGTSVRLQVVASMPHIFPIFHDFLPEAKTAVECIGRFIRSRTNASEPVSDMSDRHARSVLRSASTNAHSLGDHHDRRG